MKRQKTSFELDKALQFDIQVTQLQIICLEKLLAEKVSPNDSDLLGKLEKKRELLRLKVRKNAFELRTNINKVQEKIEIIEKLKNQEFAKTFDYNELEKVRNDLRLLMKYKTRLPKEDMPEIDIPDDIEVDEYVQLSLPFTFGVEYKHDLEELLKKLASKNIVLQKIKKGRSITQKEIDSLISIILEQNPHFSVNQLKKLYPDVASDLNLLIRNIIGIDEEEINQRINTFISKNTTLSSKQLQCLDLIKKRLVVNKYLKLESFYDRPFTLLHSTGIDGLFTKEQICDIYNLLDNFIIKENL